MEVISDETPKSPVKRGRRDSSNGSVIVANPRIPDKIKIIIAHIFEDFSKYIRKKEAIIKMKGIILSA